MSENKRMMILGMDMLLRKFSKYPDSKTFTVIEIIEASNEVYDVIMGEGETENEEDIDSMY